MAISKHEKFYLDAISAILDKQDVPNHLMAKYRQTIDNANKIYEKLDEEYFNVKDEIRANLGPQYTWKYSEVNKRFIMIMRKNLDIYLWNEAPKVVFLLWDTLNEIANEISVNIDVIIPPKSIYSRVQHYLTNRFHSLNQKRLEENIPRYFATKQQLLDDYRKFGGLLTWDELNKYDDEWKDRWLGIGPTTYEPLNFPISIHKFELCKQ